MLIYNRHVFTYCTCTREKVFHIANIFTLAFSLGCAFSPNVGSLIVLRFLCTQLASLQPRDWDFLLYFAAGLSGSAPIAIGGGAISDLFAERDRASAMALFTLGPLVGR